MAQDAAAVNSTADPVCSICIANFNGEAVIGPCLQSVLNHPVDPVIDALMKLIPVTVNAHFEDGERPFLVGIRAERSVWLPGHKADLQGVNNPDGIFQVDLTIVVRI